MVDSLDDDPQVHFDLGFAYAEMDLIEDAISELERALELDPKHRSAPEARALIERLRSGQQAPPDETIH